MCVCIKEKQALIKFNLTDHWDGIKFKDKQNGKRGKIHTHTHTERKVQHWITMSTVVRIVGYNIAIFWYARLLECALSMNSSLSMSLSKETFLAKTTMIQWNV